MWMRAFPVRPPSGVRYWTVIDEDLAVVGEADEFLRQVRFGRDGSELTTRAYASAIALYLRWCGRTGRSWQAGLEQLALFVTWLRHVPAQAAVADAGPGGAGGVSGAGAVAAEHLRGGPAVEFH
jgi:integrase/recombinase XerD